MDKGVYVLKQLYIDIIVTDNSYFLKYTFFLDKYFDKYFVLPPNFELLEFGPIKMHE